MAFLGRTEFMGEFRYGQAFTFYTNVIKADGSEFMPNPTIVSGDVLISKDGGTWNSLTTTPTSSPAASRVIKVDISATEAQATNLSIWFVDQAGSEWQPAIFFLRRAVPSVDMVSIDGEDFSGHTATLKLKNLDIQNDAGHAIRAVSTSASYAGIYAHGGYGIFADGDIGIMALGQSVGIAAEADSCGSGIGRGILASGRDDGAGIDAYGGDSGHGIQATGASTGAGIHAVGGAVSGHGIAAETVGGDGIHASGTSAVSLAGINVGVEISATEHGILISSDGVGVNITAVTDDAIQVETTGTNKKGLRIYGTGTAPAVHLRGGSTSGAGLNVEGGGDGPGILALAGDGDANGIEAGGSGTGSGILAYGGSPSSKDIAAKEIDAIITRDQFVDLTFEKNVATRHTNQKPSQYTAGTGGNQVTVNTTQDGNGSTETESLA